MAQEIPLSDPDFGRAYRFTRAEEGGYWPGGEGDPNPTDRGVRQDVYDGYRDQWGRPRQDIRAMTEDECSTIYRDYWTQAKCPFFPSWQSALAHFDMAFNSGAGAAAQMLQRVLGVTPDGVIGPKTLEALVASATANHRELLVRLTGARASRFQRLAVRVPAKAKFLKGWLKRITALQREIGVA